MQRTLFFLLIFLLIPTSASAARGPTTFSFGRSLIAASSSPGNVYLAGVSVVNTAPVMGDLSAVGGSVVAAAPVQGDELLLAGSVSSRSSVAGDMRAVGGGITIEGSVVGDVVALGYSVHDSARTQGSTFIIAVDATISGGASGPVIVYGNNILLAGDFAGNVTLIAAGRVSLAADTVIRGRLSYEAPEEETFPTSVTILGGIEYTNASYLPDVGTSRALALVSIGFFLFVRILGALILTGLLAGLFPRLAEEVALRAYEERPRRILLTMLLGFGILVATPVLIILLALTFVGIGLAFLLSILYALLVLFALLYAGILLGSMFARRFRKRETVLWHDGVFGMLALSLVALVPIFGLFVVLVLSLFTAGALLLIFFHFAFPHEETTPELL
ncbi:MAG: polymer-forming cytoskeletal protein [Patescibacteria group bacterium]